VREESERERERGGWDVELAVDWVPFQIRKCVQMCGWVVAWMCVCERAGKREREHAVDWVPFKNKKMCVSVWVRGCVDMCVREESKREKERGGWGEGKTGRTRAGVKLVVGWVS